jgi:hypothetical protein
MASEVIQLARASLKNNHSTEPDREVANKEIIAKSISNRCFLWSRVFLEITNGNVQMVNEWIKEKDEGFGSYHENAEALRVIQYQITHGEISAGLERACLLREFISERGDEKSFALLLQDVDAAIDDAMARLLSQSEGEAPIGIAAAHTR